MSLLREIQRGATDHSTPLSDILRKCLILAQRLQHNPLAMWAEQELNGYPNADSLPPYRARRAAEVRGDFRNPAWSVKNTLIPSLAVDEKHRDLLFTQVHPDGVAHYESLLRSEEHIFGAQWPADFIAIYQSRLMQGYHLTEARRVISRAEIEAMLDQIRNRILSFALEIEKENPAAGEADPGSDPPVARDKVQQSFVTHIYGGTNIVASGSQNVISDFKQVAGDWGSLSDALKELGLGEDDIAGLEAAVERDGEDAKPGPAVKEWLGDVAARIASGSLTLTTSAAGSGIATMVMKYLGVA